MREPSCQPGIQNRLPVLAYDPARGQKRQSERYLVSTKYPCRQSVIFFLPSQLNPPSFPHYPNQTKFGTGLEQPSLGNRTWRIGVVCRIRVEKGIPSCLGSAVSWLIDSGSVNPTFIYHLRTPPFTRSPFFLYLVFSTFLHLVFIISHPLPLPNTHAPSLPLRDTSAVIISHDKGSGTLPKPRAVELTGRQSTGGDSPVFSIDVVLFPFFFIVVSFID